MKKALLTAMTGVLAYWGGHPSQFLLQVVQ